MNAHTLTRYNHTTCIPFAEITCDVEDIEHGIVTSNGTYTVDTIITFACVEYYKLLSGDLERTCQSDGTFNGTAPSCTGKNQISVHRSSQGSARASLKFALAKSENGVK